MNNEPLTERNQDEKQARYEVFISFLAIFSLIVVLLIYINPAVWLTRPLIVIDFALNLLFFLDFLRSLRRAESRRLYFFRVGWLELISCIPVPLILRLARIARLARSTHFLRRMGYQGVVRQFLANRAESSLLGAAFLALFLILISSAIIVPLESVSPQANILSGDDAIWWSFVTITTVGYGDRFPVTDAGRFVAAILMTFGVGLFGVLTSYLSTNFLSHDEGVDQKILEAELKAIREDVSALRAMLEEQQKVD